MTTEVNEPIKVGAVFGDNKKDIKPVGGGFSLWLITPIFMA